MKRFVDKNILMTGAASGIGRATCLRLLAEGATVVALDISADGLAETARLADAPDRLHTLPVDVSDEAAVIDAVARAHEILGPIHALLNIAGILRVTPLAEITVDDMLEMYRVNTVSVALMCRETVPVMTDGGAIVSMASLSALQGNPYMSAYAATKGAVAAFSRTLAAELLPRGIRVFTVSPGNVNTPMTSTVAEVAVDKGLDFSYFGKIDAPFGVAAPADVAGVLAFLASDDSVHTTAVDIPVNGGTYI